ncbi:MAG: ABC transporter permease [Epulopiscium sp. Nele67-Bin004]|nr:MAG: ABC transporter permease [Epulopiscium sp. Nele67-Bin004]
MRYKIWVTFVLACLFFPIMLTFLYSIATAWHSTILPEGFTFKWYEMLFSDIAFTQSLFRTLTISAVSVLFSMSIMIPTIYIVMVYFPNWQKVLNSLVLLPYAIPGVINAVGLIRIYSQPPFMISGTVYLLVAAYFIIVLPFIYQGITSSLRNINVREIVSAAEMLGASKVQAFTQVVIPNIISGVLVSSLLSFSILCGEFVMTNFIVGGRYETVQIYLRRVMSTSGHLSSAIVISYFIFILIVTSTAIKLSKGRKQTK